jgi:hypothetical protein
MGCGVCQVFFKNSRGENRLIFQRLAILIRRGFTPLKNYAGKYESVYLLGGYKKSVRKQIFLLEVSDRGKGLKSVFLSFAAYL